MQTKFFKSSFFLLLLSSCFFEDHTPTQNELKQTLNEARYDTNILNKFSIYQSLGQFLSKNSDAIVQNEYSYGSGVEGSNIKDMPDFIYRRVYYLWKQIGEENIASVHVSKNETAIINAMFIEAPHNTLVVHQLIWNMQASDDNHSFDLVKDTLLTDDCIYRLGVSQNYSGW